MNKERIALEKIKDILLEIEKRTMSNTSFNRLAKSGMALAQQALEQSEPRMFSEEEVIGFGIWLGEKYWFNLSTYKWECRNEEGLYEVLDSKRLIELYIQSLSPKEVSQGEYDNIQAGNGDVQPKEGKEESANYVARVCEKHFWGLVETTATGQEPKTNIQCLYCGANKENGFKHTEPNQTEAEKEEIIVQDAILSLKKGLKPCPNHPDVLTSQCGICDGTFPKPKETIEALAEKYIQDEWSKDDEPVKFGIKVGYQEGYKQAIDHTSLEPNQTEAEREVNIADEIMWNHISKEPIDIKREYFAAMAMQGLLANSNMAISTQPIIDAVFIADTLINALNQPK